MSPNIRIIGWYAILELVTVSIYFIAPYQFLSTIYGRFGTLLGVFGGLCIMMIWRQSFSAADFFRLTPPSTRVKPAVIVFTVISLVILQILERVSYDLIRLLGGFIITSAIILLGYILSAIIRYQLTKNDIH